MKNGVDRDYKKGRKNNWRNWSWNRSVERLTTPPKDAVVFYLAGKQDLDRAVAKRHGFQDNNLIPVDRDAAVIARHQAEGRFAIHGDIITAALTWPRTKPLHTIHCDFTSGIYNDKLDHVTAALVSRPIECIVLNFLRGRDDDPAKTFPNLAGQTGMKHRGICSFIYIMTQIVGTYLKPCLSEAGWTEKEAAEELVKYSRPAFDQYRSGSQYFDSAVFKNPLQDWPVLHDAVNISPHILASSDKKSWRINPRHIAAIAAHHTMKAAHANA